MPSYPTIIELESRLDALLPMGKQDQRPTPALLQAAGQWSDAVWAAALEAGPIQLTKAQIERGLQLAMSPLFICGVHRSGTTLIRDLLDGHPDLTVLPAEGTFFTNQVHHLERLPTDEWGGYLTREWLRRLANPINQAPYWLLGRTTRTASLYVDFARYADAWHQVCSRRLGHISQWPHLAIVLAYAAVTGAAEAKYWVDKTPTQELYLSAIRNEMANARFIHVLRAPVDVFISRKQMEPGLNLGRCLREMAATYKIARHEGRKEPGSYLVIRYENICEDVESITGQIARFLNINFSPILLIPTVAGKPARANSSFNSELPAGAIITKPRHLQHLDAVDEQRLSAYLYRPALNIGYPLKPMPLWQSILFKPFFECRQAITRRFSL
ncbi:sulfotransferase family protein [Mucilaginibacter yixingensis]|uniref:Sulfotransferase family protein n=1 Tax=Mucilaginibacter yixingensis TaxID=1295612 RepID=A0A2T5JFL9_9SPHI|nr:sulfotransferase [Mucilaginibacter yixingensis]PTR01230.1 sulfotransferase family protein [Mucilaginibacter yixingensis]